MFFQNPFMVETDRIKLIVYSVFNQSGNRYVLRIYHTSTDRKVVSLSIQGNYMYNQVNGYSKL